MEQQLATRQRERQVAELVEDDEIEPRQVVGDAPGAPGTCLGLERLTRSTVL